MSYVIKLTKEFKDSSFLEKINRCLDSTIGLNVQFKEEMTNAKDEGERYRINLLVSILCIHPIIAPIVLEASVEHDADENEDFDYSIKFKSLDQYDDSYFETMKYLVNGYIDYIMIDGVIQ